LISEPIQV